MKRNNTTYELSSGNVFADLELRAADELAVKADLARQIGSIISQKKLTQAESARILGTTQPKVSDLLRGRLAGFSMARLIRFLNALDHDVEIRVKPRRRSKSKAQLWVSQV